MTSKQYTNNLRGICKDGSSPDPKLLAGYYERVSRYEWAVEERQYMQSIREVTCMLTVLADTHRLADLGY